MEYSECSILEACRDANTRVTGNVSMQPGPAKVPFAVCLICDQNIDCLHRGWRILFNIDKEQTNWELNSLPSFLSLLFSFLSFPSLPPSLSLSPSHPPPPSNDCKYSFAYIM